MKTLREELAELTVKARTPEAETNSIVEMMKEFAECGMDSVEVMLDTENEYKILANLTNEHCDLKVEQLDENNRVYSISWM